MKRKVGELFNKPIVQGNENVLSSNEILVEQKGNTFSLKERVNGEIKEVSGGSAGSMEYVAFDSEKDLLTYGEYLGVFAYLVKYPTKIETISLMMATGEDVNNAVAFALCPNAVIDFQGEKKTIKDWALNFGADLDALPRITEEEFYTL